MAQKNREPLSRERVLTAAMALADEGGIESLSMRKLGRALGVEAMSLYKHVENKDDLLDGILDMVVAEIQLPASERDWKLALRKRAISAREALLRHPWAAALLESRVTPTPTKLRYFEWVVATVRNAGFSLELAMRAFLCMDSHIYGFVAQELSWPFEDKQGLDDVAAELLTRIPVDEFPNLIEMTQHAMQAGPAGKEEFEFGLDLILDGLERARDA